MTSEGLAHEHAADNEEWRQVPGWEDSYEISSLGRLRSWWKSGGRKGGRIQLLTPKYKKLTVSHSGYLVVTLYDSGRKQQYGVHNLMLRAFKGEPGPGEQAAHWDGDKANNVLENLRWTTVEGNADDRMRHGTVCRGETHGMSKLTADAVRHIRMAHDDGRTRRSIAKEFSVHYTTVVAIVTGQTWRHVTC